MTEKLWIALKKLHAQYCIICPDYIHSELYDSVVALIIAADRRFIGE